MFTSHQARRSKRKNLKAENQSIVDEALHKVAADEITLAKALGNQRTQQQAGIEELRQSPFGQNLAQLVAIAEQGDIGSLSKQRVISMLDEVYQVLCQAPSHPYPLIPQSFDTSPLGVLLNQARAYMLGVQDVLNVAEAARIAQVTRATIYTLILNGILHSIDINGRTMVERRELGRIEDYKNEEGSRKGG